MLSRFALSITAATLLAGCGASQPPVGAPGAMSANVTMAMSSYHVLVSLDEGANPSASVAYLDGTFYGTTPGGGEGGVRGTVFSLSKSGKISYLHLFGPHPHGSTPHAGLINVKGVLYGTTAYGGRFGPPRVKLGYGTVFSITNSGTERILHSFRGRPDGHRPLANLVDVGGTLYGTTRGGGIHHEGTVFSITTTGKERVLYSFAGGNSDGSEPEASLIDVNGTLYGTTYQGGTYGAGTAFSISTSGTEHVVYSFGATTSDGAAPEASLIDVNGTLYGTTSKGGSYGLGTVFAVSATGSEQVLHSFAGGTDGATPLAALIDVGGTLYGTTEVGGKDKGGTIFSMSTDGNEQVLHTFRGPDGYYASASLINLKGTLYGTTAAGGSHGVGTVFALKL